MMTGYRNLTRICLAAVLAFGLAACGGGGDEKSAAELEMERLAAEEAACTSDHGRWNADNTCTSAAELVAEAAEMNCEAGGGRYNADGSCTSAADLETERLMQAEMECTGAGGRWESDDMCTTAAELVAEACVAGGGRSNADGSCTSAAELAAEQLAADRMACTDAMGRWNADNTCTDADALAAEQLAADRMACTDAMGRWNADNTCTDADGLAAEQLAADRMACTDAGGRWNGDTADDMCSDVIELADEQRVDINGKIAMAQSAVDAVNNESDEAMVTAADNAVSTASMAIANAANIDGDEKAAFNSAIGAIQDNLKTRKSNRQMAMEEAEKADGMMMVATAAKLYAGISMPTATDGNTADTDSATGTRFAQHAGEANAGDIEVAIGDADNVFLSEDEDAMVAENGGWEGKRYTRTTPASGGMYEAVVYSNVGDPTKGKKFGSTAVVTPEGDYAYQLTSGAVAVDTTQAGVPARVDLTDLDRTAGTETFMLPENNPGNAAYIVGINGKYHGVSGTYECDPNTDTAGCMASVATEGFTLTGGSWRFRPSNAETRVMSTPDSAYASYGWWIHKAANDGDFTASVFVDRKGDDPTALAMAELRGTATYMGGATGKYALSSSTGGTNDAGHFTAKAMLNATFAEIHKISGTIDNFMGADGQSRDWSVKLMESAVSDTGVIAGSPTDTTVTGAQMTEWTIGGMAEDAAGSWSGSLQEAGTDSVPEIVTGTFYSTYGMAGKMVGAFGANEQ